MHTKASPAKVRFTIVAKIILIFAIIALLAMVSMGYSIVVAQATDGDAAAINLSGSLRMQSYRLASTMQTDPNAKELVTLAQEFDQRLNSDTLLGAVPSAQDHPTNQVYRQVHAEWQEMKPLALGSRGQQQMYLLNVDDFVGHIDQMVKEFQINSEAKIRYLRTVQSVSILLALFATVVALVVLRRYIVQPLSSLTRNAQALRLGDFSQRLNYESSDELGLLSQTFDEMADNLSDLYQDLETRVQLKTSELTQSNKALQLLYDASQRFSSNPDQIFELIPDTLEALADVSEIDTAHFCEQPDEPDQLCWLHSAEGKNELCNELECVSRNISGPTCSSQGRTHFPIMYMDTQKGSLVIQSQAPLTDWQMQLMTTMADIISTAITLANHAENEARIALASERAVIARELHDSLAQNLSYQKIQATRLKKTVASNAGQEALTAVLKDLQDGISASYKQLRELITTFRIKSETPGLRPSLETTIEEFNQFSNTRFHLNFDLNIPLAPNEEIHCLHIIREAASNVIKHASATVCDITVRTLHNKIRIVIKDNGVGLPDDAKKPGHYGLNILKERTERLNGQIEFRNPSFPTMEGHGTEIIVEFEPQNSRGETDIVNSFNTSDATPLTIMSSQPTSPNDDTITTGLQGESHDHTN